jgi:hypothetical protein
MLFGLTEQPNQLPNEMKKRRSKQETLVLIFSRVRAEVLRLLFTTPKKRRHVRELAQLCDASAGTMHEELAILSAAGLLSSRSNGYHRLYWPNPHHPLFEPLLKMVRISRRLPAVDVSRLRRIQRGTVKRRPAKSTPEFYSARPYPLRWGIMSPRHK